MISYHIPTATSTCRHTASSRSSGAARIPSSATKGDANNAIDPFTAKLNGTTAWRQRLVAPNLGWLIVWLRSPLVRDLTVFGAPLLLALLGLWRIWRDPEEEIEDVRVPA